MSPIPLHIFGAGMRARVVVDHLAWHFAERYAVAGFWDDGKPAGSAGPGGFPVLGTVAEGIASLAYTEAQAFLALGINRSWRSFEVLGALRDAGVAIASLVAPSAHVAPSARLGVGALVMPGVFIGAEVIAGDLLTAQAGVSVEHHCRLGDNVLLGPGATLCGVVEVASHCFLGAGTTVIPEIRVGAGTMTGAGSVVVRHLPAGVIAMGNPATVRRPVGDTDEVPSPALVARLEQRKPS